MSWRTVIISNRCKLDYLMGYLVVRGEGIQSPELYCDGDSLIERFLHYLEASRELDGDKLYVIVNMRSFVSDKDMELYAQAVLSHGYHVLHFESSARAIIPSEKRVLIDADLCEI